MNWSPAHSIRSRPDSEEEFMVSRTSTTSVLQTVRISFLLQGGPRYSPTPAAWASNEKPSIHPL